MWMYSMKNIQKILCKIKIKHTLTIFVFLYFLNEIDHINKQKKKTINTLLNMTQIMIVIMDEIHGFSLLLIYIWHIHKFQNMLHGLEMQQAKLLVDHETTSMALLHELSYIHKSYISLVEFI